MQNKLHSFTSCVCHFSVCVCMCVSWKLKNKYGIWINLIPDGQHALAVD